jgi:hypothetical protein
MQSNWQDEANRELLAAQKAAEENLAGRSRVSARRAAGRAVREYFSVPGNQELSNNYYVLLKQFTTQPGVSNDMRMIALHLCQRVNEDYSMPDHIDLVAEARSLIQYIADQIENRRV